MKNLPDCLIADHSDCRAAHSNLQSECYGLGDLKSPASKLPDCKSGGAQGSKRL